MSGEISYFPSLMTISVLPEAINIQTVSYYHTAYLNRKKKRMKPIHWYYFYMVQEAQEMTICNSLLT